MRALAAILFATMIASAQASEVLLHAAGSLRAALTEVREAYEKGSGNRVTGTYGASGTLRDRIAAGERAEVFASANMTHPQSLAAVNKSSPVVLFARATGCARWCGPTLRSRPQPCSSRC
jgi:ABC-type molybdate transport system substrate-binding protein